MQEIRTLVFSIIKISLVIAFGFMIMAFFIFEEPLPWIAGIVFGSALGVFNFYDLSLTLMKASTMDSRRAQSHTTRKYIIRYIFMGMALFVSIKADYIHVISTILGLMLIKFVIMATNLFNDREYFKNIFRRKEDK